MFYKLTESCDLNIVGNYPQYEFYYPNEIDLGTPRLWHNKFVEVSGPIPEYRLVQRSIGTDVLTTSGWWFKDKSMVVNQKVVSILEKMTLPKYKLFSVKVYKYKNLDLAGAYYYYHSIIPESLVNFDESIFFLKDLLNNVIDTRRFSSEEDFIETKRKAKKIVPSKLVLNSNYKNFDLFFIYHGGYTDFIITSKMKQAIVDAGVTGIEIEAAPEITLL